MRIKDFDYVLPQHLIAQRPARQRSASRLLHLDGASGRYWDLNFRDVPRLIGSGDLVVVNDTRVIKARLFGRKASGGRVEALVERLISEREALAHMRASHSPGEGSSISFGDGARATVLERQAGLYRLRFEGMGVLEVLEKHGAIPLPPYIGREPDELDESRYQTVYARKPGAAAAPTAGLHFDGQLLADIKAGGAIIAYLTLHVGAGTFQPVRAACVHEHTMHRETYHVPTETVTAIEAARSRHARILAVGTTTLRALESAASGGQPQAGHGETDLFIYPGYRFRVVDRLITNFHLPRSTLLMLVSAFAGTDNIRRAYRHAIEAGYRFFSYGDAMLIERQQ
jgi:S-adenosylmethionine:tRNA ribosyltransferase-isomerase